MEAALFQEVQANSWYNHYHCLDGAEWLAGGCPAGTGSGGKQQVTPGGGAGKQKGQGKAVAGGESTLISEIARAREQIKKTLEGSDVNAAEGSDLVQQVASLQQENKELRKVTDDLRAQIKSLESRVTAIEGGKGSTPAAAKQTAAAPAAAPAAADDDDDDDDVDLFGSDDEVDEEAEKLKQQRLADYNAKKAAKGKTVIAKSSVVLDVKPWDDETDMKALENKVRSIEMDGLVWGASKLVPVAFNVKKLQIMCVVEDEKVSIEALTEEIEEFEDFVQSTDIAAFNKI